MNEWIALFSTDMSNQNYKIAIYTSSNFKAFSRGDDQNETLISK